MAAERKLFIGHKLRRLRREEGVTQAQMAHDLGISAAYLNLIEHNQRPITVNVLLRLGDAFGVNIQEFALDDSDAQSGRLREVLSDPLFAELDLTRQDLREAVERVPMVAEALQLLYARFQAGGSGQPDAVTVPGTCSGARPRSMNCSTRSKTAQPLSPAGNSSRSPLQRRRFAAEPPRSRPQPPPCRGPRPRRPHHAGARDGDRRLPPRPAR